jgi:hypothetical protein
MSFSDAHQERCRQAAAECVEMARMVADPHLRSTLLAHAREWTRLAYSNHDAAFDYALTEFNSSQLMQRQVHRQPMQQQQSKSEN